MSDVLAKVVKIAADTFDVDANEITPTSDLRNDLGAESLDLVDFAMNLEEEFAGEPLDAEAFNKIKTIQDVVDAISG